MESSGLQLELTHPVRLLCLAAVCVLLFYFWRSLVDFPRWQRSVSLAIRIVILVLLVLALAGLTLLRPTSEQFVVVAVDRSTSVGKESSRAADRFLEEALAKAGGNKFAILPFAKEPGRLQSERSGFRVHGSQESKQGTADKEQDSEKSEKDQGTSIEAALEAAVASLPPGYVPSVVLVSDGNETLGNGLKAALKAGLPVSTSPLQTRNELEVQVSAVTLPAQ